MARNTITATATGRASGAPTRAEVEINVTAGGETPAEPRATVRDRIATLETGLPSVSPEQLRTTSLTIEDTDEMFDPRTEAAYQATASITVDCQPEAVEQIVVEATDEYATIRDVQFGLSDAGYQQLADEALTGAMTRARSKANQLAAAEDTHVGEVREIESTDAQTGMDDIVDEALNSDSDELVVPERVTVTETVTVTYDLSSE